VLAHRERTGPKPTQRQLAQRRVDSGRPTPLPGPGTYAQHNAVDMPALLPDGTQSRLSVSPVLTGGPGPGGATAGTEPVELPPAADNGGQEAGDEW
jgi:NADH-quinone oxidoreductase subunit J